MSNQTSRDIETEVAETLKEQDSRRGFVKFLGAGTALFAAVSLGIVSPSEAEAARRRRPRRRPCRNCGNGNGSGNGNGNGNGSGNGNGNNVNIDITIINGQPTVGNPELCQVGGSSCSLHRECDSGTCRPEGVCRPTSSFNACPTVADGAQYTYKFGAFCSTHCPCVEGTCVACPGSPSDSFVGVCA